jgi:hypothetical protein
MPFQVKLGSYSIRTREIHALRTDRKVAVKYYKYVGVALLILGAILAILGGNFPLWRICGLLLAGVGIFIFRSGGIRSPDSAQSLTTGLGLKPLKRIPILGLFFLVGPIFMSYAGKHYPNSALIIYLYFGIVMANIAYWAYFVFYRK